MKLCAIIPSHDHYRAIGPVIETMRAHQLPVFIIDDGSGEPAKSALAALHAPTHGIHVHRLPANQGKGAAVIEGFRLAIEAGYTHAIQIDADGQHDLSALPTMLALAHQHPEALISGAAIYDDTVPRARKIGRWVTHVWVWIETLSLRISDSMCGFRVYPLMAVGQLIDKEKIGTHMQFDTDIMVRLFWRGVAPVMVPVRVFYPKDNTSNFDMWRDNVRISWMHTRLFCRMLLRLPFILTSRPPQIETTHWSKLAERGTYAGLQLTAFLCRVFGKQGCLRLMLPVLFYFYLTGTQQRRAIRDFLGRARKEPASFRDGFRVYTNFLERSLDVFLAWTGKLPTGAITAFPGEDPQKLLNLPQGALIVVSHLGNASIAHALLPPEQRERMTILAHTHHAAHFNRVLTNLCPDATMNILQVTEIGPETAISLKQHIDNGQHVVIAGDRTAVLSRDHATTALFFGAPALFPQGPWIMAALLGCPVYLLFCVKDGAGYRLALEPFAEHVILPRETRMLAVQDLAARYAARLEYYATAYPFQWYNFFDFWTLQ